MLLKIFFLDFLYLKYQDVAILKLEKEALPSSKVGYICLPANSSYVDLTGIELTISGWGLTSSEGQMSDVLLKATVYGVNVNMQEMNKVTENMLCAAKNQTDACGGDSGGNI